MKESAATFIAIGLAAFIYLMYLVIAASALGLAVWVVVKVLQMTGVL